LINAFGQKPRTQRHVTAEKPIATAAAITAPFDYTPFRTHAQRGNNVTHHNVKIVGYRIGRLS
jgi:hypothetical protein